MSEVATILLQKEREFVSQYYNTDGMTDEDIDKKFSLLCEMMLTKDQ